jgi:CRP-like cAMP-binding protein
MAKGACVGEMALLDREPRSADVTTVDSTTLLKIEQDAFYEVLSRNQELMLGMIRLLTSRLRAANASLSAAADG